MSSKANAPFKLIPFFSSSLLQASPAAIKWNLPRSKCRRPILNDPPWLDDVKVTPELLYRYQLETKELVDVLRHDMDMLKKLRQVLWSLTDVYLFSILFPLFSFCFLIYKLW